MTPIQSVGIVGVGLMGRAIASECVHAGLSVKLTDTDPTCAQEAISAIKAALHVRDQQHTGRRWSSAPIAVADLAEIARSDLVIEAVSENLATKTAVLVRICPWLTDEAMIATNTSSIPLAELAGALSNPARFCGLHFCHPVAQRPLVEVVASHTTNSQTIRRACGFAASLGKSPVVVRDGPGFVLNRVLSPYLTESLELLLEGTTVEELDEVATAFGMPCGPLRQLDEFGLEIALAVGGTLMRAFPERFIASELLIAVCKSQRKVRQFGSGFYASDSGTHLDCLTPAVEQIILDRRRSTPQPTPQGARCRMLLPMLLEAARVLEEGLVDSPKTVDTILRDGLGMTASSPGLFGWARRVGAGRIHDWLQPLAPLGQRFLPTPNLKALLDRSAAT